MGYKVAVSDIGTFGIIKGPSVSRQHSLSIMDRIRQKRLRITNTRLMTATPQQIDALYKEHLNHKYYHFVQKVMLAPHVIIPFTVLPEAGRDVVRELRDLIGEFSDSRKCLDGTLRREFGGVYHGSHPDIYADNAVHGSDSHDEALREAGIFFTLT